MIIGVIGSFGSGKGTVAKMMATYLRENQYTCIHKIFAGKLKEIVSTLTGIPMDSENDNDFCGGIDDFSQEKKNIFIPEFSMTIGQMLQKIGTEVFRDNFDKDTWVKSTFRDYDPTDDDTIWIIPDTRFPNEVDVIKDIHNGYLVKVESESPLGNEDSGRSTEHRSETALNGYDRYDAVIKNDSTLDELSEKVKEVLINLELI